MRSLSCSDDNNEGSWNTYTVTTSVAKAMKRTKITGFLKCFLTITTTVILYVLSKTKDLNKLDLRTVFQTPLPKRYKAGP